MTRPRRGASFTYSVGRRVDNRFLGLRFGLRSRFGTPIPGYRDLLGGYRVEMLAAPAAHAPGVHSHRVTSFTSDPGHIPRILRSAPQANRFKEGLGHGWVNVHRGLRTRGRRTPPR